MRILSGYALTNRGTPFIIIGKAMMEKVAFFTCPQRRCPRLKGIGSAESEDPSEAVSRNIAVWENVSLR